MKRLVLVVALVAMAGCKKAEQQPAQGQMMGDTTKMMMGDTTKMMMGDTTKHMMADTGKMMKKRP